MFIYISIKKITLLILILLSIQITYAQIKITEIMYDAEGSDGGKEYIEIINQGASVDLSKYIFIEHGRRHRIKGESTSLLNEGEIAVIVDKIDEFKKNYPNKKVKLFDSSFSLNNKGSTLEFSIDGNVVSKISYKKEDGANGNGNSLHIGNLSKITQGAPAIGSTDIGLNNLSTSPTSNTTTPIKTEQKEEYVLEINKERIFTKSSFEVRGLKKNSDGREVGIFGEFNFGDGIAKKGKVADYSYDYSGNYILTFSVNNLIVAKKEISVIDAKITFEVLDNYFILKNSHNFNFDISNWYILADNKKITIPKNTFVTKNGTIRMDFNLGTFSNISLFNQDGNLIYKKAFKREIPQTTKSTGQKQDNTKTSFSIQNVKSFLTRSELEVETINSTAKIKTEEMNNRNIILNIVIWLSILVGIIILSIIPLILLKNKEEE